MKLALKLSLFLFVNLILVDKSFSLTDYQIKNICKKEVRVLSCIKNFQEKKFNLRKGNLIEIPVIPYKR
jgi:hypothetical protein